MRIKSDIRKAVVFLGHMEAGAPFRPAGTGFLLLHDRLLYLVTARHVAEHFGDDPFYLRMNHGDGKALDAYCDPLSLAELNISWFFPEDPNVDVAVMPFAFKIDLTGADYLILGTEAAVDHTKHPELVETGDFCYVVGLFGVQCGKGRMMPVIHTGHIAMMPDPREPIPTQDWRGTGLIDIEGYLVEISNLQGLSGSPVLVRPTMKLGIEYRSGKAVQTAVGADRYYLLGVWQGSWEGQSALDPLFARHRVPVGMGVVTPAEKLLDLLNSASVMENRRQWMGSATAAVPDAPA